MPGRQPGAMGPLACAALYRRMHGLSHMGLRYFNVYGPGQDPDANYSGVKSKFIRAVQQGDAIRIFGDEDQSGNFVFVKDVAEVNRRALLSKSVEVCNVASGKRHLLDAPRQDAVCAVRQGL